MLLLHAIARTETSSAPHTGLRGGALRRIESDGLAAVATQFEAMPTDLGRRDLLAAHEIVMQLGDCLPVRFPSWFEGEPDVRAYVRERASELISELDRLHGLCELAVTVVWTSPVHPQGSTSPASTGAQYLLERRRKLAGSEQRRKRAVDVQAMLERTAPGRWSHRLTPSDSVALSSALLIPRTSAVEIRARLLEGVGIQQDVRILVNGPWPPYTFVSLSRAREASNDDER